MKIGNIGFLFICVMHCAEMSQQEIWSINSEIDIVSDLSEIKSTSGFFAQSYTVDSLLFKGNLARVSGVCHGTGPQGGRFAAIVAQAFQNHLESYMRGNRETFEKEEKFKEAEGYIEHIFGKIHRDIRAKHTYFLKDNTCGVALVYEDIKFKRLACFHVSPVMLFAANGFKKDVEWFEKCAGDRMQEGGIEKCTVPYKKVTFCAPDSFVLMGHPRVIEYLHGKKESKAQKYLKSRADGIQEGDNIAHELFEHADGSFQWFMQDTGIYRFLAWRTGS